MLVRTSRQRHDHPLYLAVAPAPARLAAAATDLHASRALPFQEGRKRTGACRNALLPA